MKLWKLKYMVMDKIRDIKDYLMEDTAVLAYRVVAIALLIGVVVFIINKKFG